MPGSLEPQLWEKIQAFELDDPDAALTFSERLARENAWTIDYALRSIDEYKKFMYLICITDHPLTPSDQVDQVWHLHLLYTQSYWIRFCEGVLKRTIHHGPTKGGVNEQEKFYDWYEKTKQLYRLTFQENPPKDIWPLSSDRFNAIDFVRVNRSQYWLFKKFF
jgi:hypothetical protein